MLDFGRHLCNRPGLAGDQEWLVTNGLGGFAAGTISGELSRRDHGLLIAALEPPQSRTLLVSRVDEDAFYLGEHYDLATNRWDSQPIQYGGFKLLDSFRLDGTTPVWTYALGEALLEKRIWMAQGANTTYLRYDLVRGREPVDLVTKVLVNFRDFHSLTRGSGWQMAVREVDHGLEITAYDGARPFYLLSTRSRPVPEHIWYQNYYLAFEAYRGLDHLEDHLLAGHFQATVAHDMPVTFAFSTEAAVDLDGMAAFRAQKEHETRLWQLAADAWGSAAAELDQPGLRQLVLAADQFIVSRPTPDNPGGKTVIAGYPWFGDWGRDTMIALPGLTLATGRPEVARELLLTFAHFIDQGMLPNRFPDGGEVPEYNTVDATLWYFEAIRAYVAATNDTSLIDSLWERLVDIIDWHIQGTRYGIRQDPADGLLQAGEPGVQLTWMDARVGDWVVTPRIGKPVEINALWYNALQIIADLARQTGRDGAFYQEQADRVAAGFSRFWNPDRGCCYDVLDGPDGHDPTLRPNQLLAISLARSPLKETQQKQVVDICSRRLLTPHGLRSLAADEPDYTGRYGGPPHARDGAYHQGTVWAWLIGPFVTAHLRVYQDLDAARAFLTPLRTHLGGACVGTQSEIFDGDPPFTPRGAFAQAWSVAELLRVWLLTA